MDERAAGEAPDTGAGANASPGGWAASQISLPQEALFFLEPGFVAFACDSWLLDAQLEGLLPPLSNIVRFLRRLYLVPSQGNPESALEWVFDGMPADPARAPRDTLRRMVVDHPAGVGELYGAAGFLLPEVGGEGIVYDRNRALGRYAPRRGARSQPMHREEHPHAADLRGA